MAAEGVVIAELSLAALSPMTRRVQLSHYFDFVPMLLANGIGVVVGLLCACLAETALGLLLVAFAFLSLAFDMTILVFIFGLPLREALSFAMAEW